jgi:hypothetical protein
MGRLLSPLVDEVSTLIHEDVLVGQGHLSPLH